VEQKSKIASSASASPQTTNNISYACQGKEAVRSVNAMAEEEDYDYTSLVIDCGTSMIKVIQSCHRDLESHGYEIDYCRQDLPVKMPHVPLFRHLLVMQSMPGL
jgi:hypothetical protein